MKLSNWAKKNGLCYRTAWNLFHAGQIPGSRQLESGTILVDDITESKENKQWVIYARVSSRDQKDDLYRQIDRLKSFCSNRGIVVSRIVSDIGSGLNGKRRNLICLLSNPVVNLVVEHRDRLVRFGFDYINETMKSFNREILVIDETEYKDDLVQDFVDLATSMCAKIYGRRSAKNRAKRALEATRNE